MKRALKIIGFVVVGLVLVVAGGVLYLRYAFPNVDAAPTLNVEKTPALVERGEYLANHVAVCIDCHSTRDWSRYSGPPVPGTFGKGGDVFDHSVGFPGTFYAKNITSDKETGIGTWTDGELYRAITSGVSKDGSPLFPVMPYRFYNQMTDADAHAIIAYIRTLAPIKHKVPESKPDFPMNLIMRTMPTKRMVSTEPVLDNQLSQGKYLFTVAACAECHTPQEKGAPIEGMYLAGGFEFKFPNGAVVRSANITPDKQTGIGNWTEEAFVQRFKMYQDSAMASNQLDGDDFNTIMPWKMYSGMTENDLKAIYRYLMTIEPNPNKVERYTPAP